MRDGARAGGWPAWTRGLMGALMLGSVAGAALPARAAGPAIEPEAVALLRQAGETLAAARSFSFTATAMHEAPTAEGQPVFYTQRSRIDFARPNRLRVTTIDNGPASVFVSDGTSMMNYRPLEGTLASAPAGEIDQILRTEAQTQGRTAAFADLLLSDPSRNFTDGLTRAFVVGRSSAVAGGTTDVVSFAKPEAQVQVWIGSKDHLPRQMVVTFTGKPGRPRDTVSFSNWRVDERIPDRTFRLSAPKGARSVPFPQPGT